MMISWERRERDLPAQDIKILPMLSHLEIMTSLGHNVGAVDSALGLEAILIFDIRTHLQMIAPERNAERLSHSLFKIEQI